MPFANAWSCAAGFGEVDLPLIRRAPCDSPPSDFRRGDTDRLGVRFGTAATMPLSDEGSELPPCCRIVRRRTVSCRAKLTRFTRSCTASAVWRLVSCACSTSSPVASVRPLSFVAPFLPSRTLRASGCLWRRFRSGLGISSLTILSEEGCESATSACPAAATSSSCSSGISLCIPLLRAHLISEWGPGSPWLDRDCHGHGPYCQ